MADDSSRSPKLLFVAGALAVAFLVLFNVQRWYENSQRQANQVALVLVTQDLAPGAVLKSDNVSELSVPRDVAEKLKGVHTWGKDQTIILGTSDVTRAVAKNSLLRLSDTSPSGAEGEDPSRAMRRGWRILPLQIDGDAVPAAYIRRGSRVDMFAVLPGSVKPGLELVIEYLEVMGVDRQVEVDPQKGSFRNVIVQVPEDLAGKLLEVKRRARQITLVVRRGDDVDLKYPQDKSRPEIGGTITPTVLDSLAKPYDPGSRAAGTGT
jgi:Flp pilus assembly protein CpaB